jgi:hypothetical protein
VQFRFAFCLVDPSTHPFPGDTVIGLGLRLYTRQLHIRKCDCEIEPILLVWEIACVLTPSYYRRNVIL